MISYAKYKKNIYSGMFNRFLNLESAQSFYWHEKESSTEFCFFLLKDSRMFCDRISLISS